jgi:hypothetical protein
MTPGELADIRLKDSQSASAYIDRGVVESGEVRERLARDPASGFQGLDTSVELVPPSTQPGADDLRAALDAEFKESEHPRAANGQFGSGGEGASKSATEGLTAERGRFDWEIKNQNGDIVGKYPSSLSRKAALEKHAEVMAIQASKKAKSKESAKANKETREKDRATLESLNTAFNENHDLIEHAHMNANLTFTPMSAEAFSAKATIPIYRSPGYGKKKGSEYRLVMIDGKPAYARESDHWGKFSTNSFVDGELVGTVHDWKLPGAESGWGNSERSAGYILLEDLPDSPSNAQDKSVSAAQHRAMEAAAHGHSTLGIPEEVGKEFVAKDAAS